MLLRKKNIYDAILKTLHERNSKIFFFLTVSRVNEKRVGENGRKRHVKISKVEFGFFFNVPQYSNSCEEYFSGEEFKVGTFLSTVPIQKNS